MLRGVLLDIAGVLYDGDSEIPGAGEAVSRLRDAGIPVRYITNTTRRPKCGVLEKLASFGFAPDASEVLTPAEAACAWLRREGYSPHLLVHPDLERDFADVPKAERVAVVVGDAGDYFTYDRMNAAFRELVDGAPFVALAANRVFRDTDGELSLDAGAFVRALEYSSGTTSELLGKPAAAFFMAGVVSMGCAPQDVAMIGDDPESDIAGAIAAGIGQGILVRTGKYRDGDETRYQPAPTNVAPTVREAIEAILRESSS